MIDAAIELLRGYGLSGAGINDIVRESGTPRGSLYHFFPNGKLQITSEALQVYVARVEKFIDEALRGRKSGAQKIQALFQAFATRVEAGQFQKSCALGTVTLDLGEDLEELRLQLAAGFARWAAVIESHLQPKRRSNSFPFASFVLTTIEGAYIRARAERSADAFRESGYWLAQLARLNVS